MSDVGSGRFSKNICHGAISWMGLKSDRLISVQTAASTLSICPARIFVHQESPLPPSAPGMSHCPVWCRNLSASMAHLPNRTNAGQRRPAAPILLSCYPPECPTSRSAAFFIGIGGRSEQAQQRGLNPVVSLAGIVVPCYLPAP